jgi:hypothetical protein
VNGPFTDEDIEKVRSLALAARAKAALGMPAVKQMLKPRAKIAKKPVVAKAKAKA